MSCASSKCEQPSQCEAYLEMASSTASEVVDTDPSLRTASRATGPSSVIF